MLTWAELQDVLLDIEVALNNHPLSNVEDDPQLPVLSPNSLVWTTQLTAGVGASSFGDARSTKANKYVKRSKDVLWKWWTHEYLESLCKERRLNHPVKSSTIPVGDVMLIKEEERNQGKWKMGKVDELITGRDGVEKKC